jgi:DNA polymerase (family 10)
MSRLEEEARWVRRALNLVARFTISSDAHSTRELECMQFGLGSARRGWLTAKDMLNTRPLEELRAALPRRGA